MEKSFILDTKGLTHSEIKEHIPKHYHLKWDALNEELHVPAHAYEHAIKAVFYGKKSVEAKKEWIKTWKGEFKEIKIKERKHEAGKFKVAMRYKGVVFYITELCKHEEKGDDTDMNIVKIPDTDWRTTIYYNRNGGKWYSMGTKKVEGRSHNENGNEKI